MPNDKSIFGSKPDPFNLDSIVQWRRPVEFIDQGNDLAVFKESIEPTDIKQGQLENGWMLNALSQIAEKPELIDRLFITKNYQKNGVYRVKICKNGEWITVTVDDYFPCYPMSGPMFSRSHGNELWVLILEKAYAKIHGNYFSIKNGQSVDALSDFTGCPTETIIFDKNSDLASNNGLWELLKDCDNQQYIISAFTSKDQEYFQHKHIQ